MKIKTGASCYPTDTTKKKYLTVFLFKTVDYQKREQFREEEVKRIGLRQNQGAGEGKRRNNSADGAGVKPVGRKYL